MNDTLDLTTEEDVAVLTLKRPQSLDVAGKHAIADALEPLRDDDTLRALIIVSGHPQAFLVNVAELADFDGDQALDFSRSGHRVADALSALPFPTIAAVSGAALGGGCELVLACDLAYAAETAQFGQIEVSGGLIPGFGGTWRLPRRVGIHRAYELIFTGQVITAERAREIGLVLDVIPGNKLLPHCKAVAAEIATTSRSAVAAVKKVMLDSIGLTPAEANAIEQPAFAERFGPEQRARMHAFVDDQRRSQAKPVIATLLWATDGKSKQDRLVAAMQAEASALAAHDGFISLQIRPSLDGQRVLVEGAWANLEAFQAATSDGSGRDTFAKFGRLDEVIVAAAPDAANARGDVA